MQGRCQGFDSPRLHRRKPSSEAISEFGPQCRTGARYTPGTQEFRRPVVTGRDSAAQPDDANFGGRVHATGRRSRISGASTPNGRCDSRHPSTKYVAQRASLSLRMRRGGGGGRSAGCVVGEECVDHGRRDDDASAEAQRGEFLRLHTLIGGGPRDPKDRSSFVNAVRAPCRRQLAVRRRAHEVLAVARGR